jgi:hypothetical protein
MATVPASYNWVSGYTVTPTKLNSTAAPTVVVADNEITTAKIADANVTTAKILDANITTAKIADAAVTQAKLAQPLTLATVQATNSGTSIDFTGIPSWVRRITVMLNGVSLSANAGALVQIGDSGGIETSDYVGNIGVVAGTGSGAIGALSDGFLVIYPGTGAEEFCSGLIVLSNLSGNTWVCSGNVARSFTTVQLQSVSGIKTLSATLDRLRFAVSGVASFDAGQVNIMYEG